MSGAAEAGGNGAGSNGAGSSGRGERATPKRGPGPTGGIGPGRGPGVLIAPRR